MLGLALLLLQGQVPRPVHDLLLGSERTALLAPTRGTGATPPSDLYHMEFPAPTVLTLKLRSLDFQPLLIVRDATTHEPLGRTLMLLGDDAWWAEELPGQSALEIEIGSADMRTGEYTLAAIAGAVPWLWGPELARAQRQECESIARRAEARAEPGRAIDYWLRAGRIALDAQDAEPAFADLRRGRELAERESEGGAALEARLFLALVERLRGDKIAALGALQSLEHEFAVDALAVSGTPAEPQRAFLRTLFYGSLADLRREQVGLLAAVLDYRRAAEASELTHLPYVQVDSLTKLAFALEETGEPEAADWILEHCDAIVAACPPATDQETALETRAMRSETLLTRARNEAIRGASSLARAHALEALALEFRPALRAELIGTIAKTCLDDARYEEAAAWLEELRTLVAEQGLSELEIPEHRALGVLAWRLRDLPLACQEFRLALDLAEAGGSIEAASESRLDLALVLNELDSQAAAEELLDRVIRDGHAAGNFRLEGLAWLDRGCMHDDCGELDLAEQAYGNAARYAAAAEDPALGALARCNLGFVAFLRGDATPARQLSAEAAAELEVLGLREEALDAHDTLARLALAGGEREALRIEIDAARRLLEGLERQKLEPLQRAWHRSRFADWGAHEQSLVALGLQQDEARSERGQAALRDGFDAVSEWKGRVLLEGLCGRGAGAGGRARASSTERLTDLPPHTALLDYFESDNRLGVYLVQSGRIERIELDERASMAQAAARFANQVSDRYADPRKLIAASAALWTTVLAPALAELEPGIETLMIVPSQALAGIPFEALVSDPRLGSSPVCGEPRCVIDDFLVCYLPAADLLPVLAEIAPRAPEERHLILGDAIYAGENSDAGAREAQRIADKRLAVLGRLLSSREEARGLADLLLLPGEIPDGDPSPSISAPGRSQRLFGSCFDLYLGTRASRELFDRDLRGYSELHLALHSHADATDPRRSVLVLSGSGERSGVVTLEEILHTSLDAELVVLSACSTARGPAIRGEGVQSIAYAFMNAGARAVVATRWDVIDSEASQILFGFELLRRWPDGQHLDQELKWRKSYSLVHGLVPLHPAQALRAARQAFRELNTPRGHGVDDGSSWAPWKWAAYMYLGAPPE